MPAVNLQYISIFDYTVYTQPFYTTLAHTCKTNKIV